MTKNQLLALAAFITSLANDGECSTTTETAPAGDPPAPKKPRGRPPGTATPPPAGPVIPADPVTTAPPPAQGQAASVGKTIDDMRALIEPLIKAARGGEVKPIILKYAPTLAQMDAKDYPAFEKGIEALLY